MTTKIPLFLLIILFSILLFSCRPSRDISGKWIASYTTNDKTLGTVNMKFIMNINQNFKYSITTKGDIPKHNLSKVFSRKSGVWIIQSGMITFTPLVCSEANAKLILEEVKCDSVSQPIKAEISNDTWEYSTSDGRSLKLVREP